MVEDVKGMMDKFLEVSLFRISTSCNVASDALAKHAQVIEGPLIWLELSPPCLQNILYKDFHYIKIIYCTTTHPWCDGHSTGTNTCEVWEARTGVQVSMRKFHTHIHLDYVKVEFYLI